MLLPQILIKVFSYKILIRSFSKEMLLRNSRQYSSVKQYPNTDINTDTRMELNIDTDTLMNFHTIPIPKYQ